MRHRWRPRCARPTLRVHLGVGNVIGSARRWAAVAVVGVTVLAGCRVPGVYFPGHGPAEPSGVHIVAPTNASQAPASGEVAVDVRLDDHLDPATLKVSILSGWPEPTSSTTLSGSRINRDATGGTVALHAADLTPGLVTIRALAYTDDGRDRESGWASISWEPGVALDTAGRCDPIATKTCLMPFPNDFFTVADPSSATGRRVHFDPAAMPTNSDGAPPDPTE